MKKLSLTFPSLSSSTVIEKNVFNFEKFSFEKINPRINPGRFMNEILIHFYQIIMSIIIIIIYEINPTKRFVKIYFLGKIFWIKVSRFSFFVIFISRSKVYK